MSEQNKIFVSNFPFSFGDEELRRAFEKFGNIKEIAIPTDRDSGRPRGFAFITFEEDNAVQPAIDEMNGQDLGGRNLRVNRANSKTQEGRGNGGRGRGGRGAARG